MWNSGKEKNWSIIIEGIFMVAWSQVWKNDFKGAWGNFWSKESTVSLDWDGLIWVANISQNISNNTLKMDDFIACKVYLSGLF